MCREEKKERSWAHPKWLILKKYGTLRSETKSEWYAHLNYFNLQQITNKLTVLTDFKQINGTQIYFGGTRQCGRCLGLILRPSDVNAKVKVCGRLPVSF